jgi:putative peptidoglycan lipid II flippase
MWIAPWAPSALFYSERLIYFPLGVIATALATVLLPTFSIHAAEKNIGSMRETISHSLRHLIYIMTPAALGLLVLAPFILKMIFEWGGIFNAESTLLSARALRFYAPGLIVFSAAKVFVPAFYAMQDTKTPVRIGIYIVLLNLTLNITFILTLPLYWKHAGMAASTVIAEAAGMTVLGILLTRRIKNLAWKGILHSFIRCLCCAVIMAVAAGATAWLLHPLFDSLVSAKLAQFCTVSISIAVGVFIYLGLSIVLHSPELHEIKSAIRKR